jgi:hypothetical protein
VVVDAGRLAAAPLTPFSGKKKKKKKKKVEFN